jgi:hypothetical protein
MMTANRHANYGDVRAKKIYTATCTAVDLNGPRAPLAVPLCNRSVDKLSDLLADHLASVLKEARQGARSDAVTALQICASGLSFFGG